MKSFFSSSTASSSLAPLHLVALVDVGLFALLSGSSGSFEPQTLLFGVALAVLAYGTGLLLIRFRMGDTYICSIVSMLVGLGLAMQYRLSPSTGIRQFVWFLVGTAVFMGVNLFYTNSHERYRRIWLSYGGMILLFVLTLVLGTDVKGARNWIILGGFTMQPSEFIKILFIFFLASYVSDPSQLRLKTERFVLRPRWVLMGLVFLLLGLFALQREFGTALLIFLIYLSVLYVFDGSLLFPAGNVVIAGLGAAVALKTVHHLQVRIDTWLDPWADAAGKGYQITQALFAIGSGGFFGTGLGLGHPQYIPAVHTDFIFAAICEEMGIFGGMAVVLLFFLLAYRGIKIALRLQDRYRKAMAFGLTVLLGFQTFIIIGGDIKLIPLTGITLPFVSYGGSSLLASYTVLGLLQALSGPILREEVMSREDGFGQ